MVWDEDLHQADDGKIVQWMIISIWVVCVHPFCREDEAIGQRCRARECDTSTIRCGPSILALTPTAVSSQGTSDPRKTQCAGCDALSTAHAGVWADRGATIRSSIERVAQACVRGFVTPSPAQTSKTIVGTGAGAWVLGSEVTLVIEAGFQCVHRPCVIHEPMVRALVIGAKDK